MFRIRYLFWGLLSVLALSAGAQPAPCRDVHALIGLLNAQHVQPIATEFGLSADIPATFFNTLDPSGLFLSRADRLALAWPENDIYEADACCALLKATTALYKKRLQSADSALVQLARQQPTYATDERWVEDVTLAPACPQADRLRQMVKLQVLEAYLTLNDTLANRFDEVEPTLRAQVCERMRCRIKRKQRMPEGLDRYIGNLLLDAIATSYDPHSAFFTEDAKNGFESGLSTSAQTYGLWVNETESGEIALVYLTPAGPAQATDLLAEGDILTFLRFGNAPPVNLACTYADEINEKLAAVPAPRLTLRVRHKTGKTEEVCLFATEMPVEENAVYSLVLEDSLRIGYLYLPGFYSDWGNDDASGSALDVARELMRLGDAGVSGMILDLRGNGGGSVEEALQLAGLFIEDGPLGMFVDKKGGAMILRDRMPGIVYAGPLVVMVDSWSASASEMFAAMMQDYHRAVIVGDTTYGKATVQSIFPLPGNASAFVKITTNHFCRITGHSHQGFGVYPDVSYPLDDPGEEHESDLPGVLEPAMILKKQIRFQAQTALPAGRLRQQAAARAAASATLAAGKRLSQQFASFYRETESLLLQPETFRSYDQRWQHLLAQSRELDSMVENSYTTHIPNHWQARMETRPQLRETLSGLRKTIQQDMEVEHAFGVMLDLLRQHHD